MTWVDLAVFGVLAISGLLAFVRGLVREVLGIGAWAGAVAAGIYALPTMRPYVSEKLHEPDWVDPVSFFIVFLITLIVLMLIARAIGSLIRGSPLGGIDRTLGLVFGIARGAVVVVIAYILAGMAVPIGQWPDPVLKARTLPLIFDAAAKARDRLPEDYRPRIYPPPEGRETTEDDLLRASPQGRATGTPPVRQ